MSSTDEIRAALKSGPMKPSEIADHLGITDQGERTLLYTAVRQLHVKGRGLELLDDGRVSLVPNWKPTRGAAKAKPEPKARRAAKKAKAKTKAARPERAERPAPATSPRAAAAAAPRPSEPAPGGAVQLPRQTVRTLLAFIMQSARPLNSDTRAAVLESIEVAA